MTAVLMHSWQQLKYYFIEVMSEGKAKVSFNTKLDQPSVTLFLFYLITFH